MKTAYSNARSLTISKYKKMRGTTPRHIIMRLLKNSYNKRTLLCIKRKNIWLIQKSDSDFSLQTEQARRQWSNVFKAQEEKQKSVHLESSTQQKKVSFQSQGYIKTFLNTQSERIYHQQNCTTGNTRASPSGRRNMIPAGIWSYMEE